VLLLTAFAFLAGVVTILSPCILPVLPIVLTSSLGGGRSRAFGVVAGFVMSFTFFTLFLTTLVRAVGIPADSLRTLSVVIIAVFGLTLLLPSAQRLTEKLFARLSSLVPNTANKSGFFGGVVVGISLGLIWTPCVGPILASVISLALTGSVTGTAVILTLAYALGTALPMLVIILGGQSLLSRNRWLLSRAAFIQQVFGLIMIVTAAAIYFNLDRRLQTYILDKFPGYGLGLTRLEDTSAVRHELDKLNAPSPAPGTVGRPTSDMLSPADYGLAPELMPGGSWFNLPAGQKALTLAGLRGQVVLVDFWTYTCINCIRTLPYLKAWDDRYRDSGLVIIGVHTPEFEFEKSAANVATAIRDFGLKYPVMQDNDYATWRAYQNNYWPAKYLIDSAGRIRYTHFGEEGYDQTEAMIQKLLTEAGSPITVPIDNPDYQNFARTPELYVGSDRFVAGSMSFSGDWIDRGEYREAYPGATLTLDFNAKEVFLVMRPGTKATPRTRILLDGQPVPISFAGLDTTKGAEFLVRQDRLYKLINLPQAGSHTLTIEFINHPVELFAFTFG